MKKNKMMRLASAMMVLTLMSTSVISGTFAKYVTSDSAKDEARVAKWGIEVSVGGNLFGTDYAAHSTTDPDSDGIIELNTSTSVNAFDDKNIVAPGTKNETAFTVEVSGTPEVAYSLAATAGTVEDIFLAAGSWGTMVPAYNLNAATNFGLEKYYTLSGTTYTKATEFDSSKEYYELHDEFTLSGAYYPITWTIGNTGRFEAITAKHNLTQIAADMAAGISEATTLAANSVSDGKYTIGWKWEFEGQSDYADTVLGNLMAKNAKAVVVKTSDSGATYSSTLTDGTDYNLDVKFDLTVTVTQVD